ncbi:hypothetical protein MFLAVUS_003900 [Mucor flavus]|uniref:RRM domain-containing protein n=1 Tax=Mucor flavus TaxID=439312 RepID=A0ABP9YUE1_9FUNG
MNQHENGNSITLIVKHLPDFIAYSNELRSSYFRPYKPLGVRFMQSQSMPGFVFLDFPDRDTAEAAYEKLKTINFGLYYKQVSVEYAKPDPNGQQLADPITMSIEQQEQAADPISLTQGILYPPNPHLQYFYPDPTPDILANISNAIGTVPRFYTQVLHLMNKYNMPPPFGPIDKESIPSLLKRKRDDLLASDESELEDDDDHSDEMKLQEEKVKQARLGRIAAEKQKLAISTTLTASTTSNAQAIKNTPKIKINIGKQVAEKLASPTLSDEQKSIRDKCLSMSELINLPAFKNYTSGTPSNKLYVKNLSKQVTEQDLIDLYSNFSPNIQVNLMKKGRLRDQAFVEFSDEKQANLALICTNGYVLVDRPMAVLFSKSAT